MPTMVQETAPLLGTGLVLLLVAARLLLALLVASLRRAEAAGRRASPWEAHVGKGSRVLLLGSASGEWVSRGRELGATVEAVPLDGAATGGLAGRRSAYHVVVADGCLSRLPEDVARATVQRLCGLLRPGGVLVVQDLAVLPASSLVLAWRPCLWLARLAWAALSGRPSLPQPPYDAAAWLPGDMHLESRGYAGLRREVLTARKLAAGPHAEVERLRRLYGDTSMAYCTSPAANRIGGAERQLHYCLAAADGSVADGAATAVGYVAYVEHVVMGLRLRLVITDPVCAHADQEATLRPFLASSAAVKARVGFAAVSSAWKGTLQRLGFYTTMLGAEVGIRLADYRLSKERRRYLRIAPARGLECHSECHDLQELEEVNAAWVGAKASATEVVIWTWPPSLPRTEGPSEDPDAKPDEVRRLFTYQDGRLVGFVCAEPYYSGDGSGEVLGYGLNTIRFLPQVSPPWISDFTVASLIQSLQSEGKAKFLAFGLSPWSEVVAHEGEVPWMRRLNQMTWHMSLEDIYSVQGLARKKAHHCAGQGVRLHDRFSGGTSAGVDAFVDCFRFMHLLLGDASRRVPGVLASCAGSRLSSAARRAGRLLSAHLAGAGPALRGCRAAVAAAAAGLTTLAAALPRRGEGF